MAPRHSAGIISWQAGPADVRPEGVDRARCRHANIPHKGGAAVAVAAHAPVRIINEGARNAIEIGIVLQREPRPLGRIGTTGPACLAHGRSDILHLAAADHDRERAPGAAWISSCA